VTATVPVPVPLVAFCWNRIGVNGDRSCPELPKVTHCRNCPVFATGGNLLFDRPPPAGYADEWADRIARPDAPPAGRTVEAAPVPVVRRVPHQRDRVLAGLVNIRGELLPAVSLRDLLGAGDGDPATADPAKRRLLVAERDGVRWAFVADEVFDVRHLPEADLGAVPGTVKAGATFTRGVFRWDDRAVGYLDPDRLFGALKRSFR